MFAPGLNLPCKVKQLKAIFHLIIILSLMPFWVVGQTYTSTSKKAIRHFEKAMEHFNARENGEAIVSLRSAIDQDPTFVEPHILLATIFTENKETDKAIEAYNRSFELSPDFYPPNYYNVGMLELSKGYYAKAGPHFDQFLSYPGFDSDFVNKARHNSEVCAFAQHSMKNPVPFECQKEAQPSFMIFVIP